MTTPPALIAVDWGTSSFRLWLLSRDGTVLAEHRSHEGMSEVAERGFETVLETHLQTLSASPTLPVVICGMAGSRQGWVEAGYIDPPADVTTIEASPPVVPDTARKHSIIPSLTVRSESQPDVMLGGEKQQHDSHLYFPRG